MKKISLILFLLCFPTLTLAGNIYWVDDDGSTTWAQCQSETPLRGSSCCSLSTANSNASAGDRVYLRAGTYTITGTGIDPTNSGSADNLITLRLSR